jgi:hypothetical protein
MSAKSEDTALKRDMDLIRGLLLKLEQQNLDGNEYDLNVAELGIARHSNEEVAYHVELLIDAGFLDAERTQSGSFVARKLTFAGCDFIDSVRDPKIWRMTKAVAKKVGGFTAAALVAAAKAIVKEGFEKLATTRSVRLQPMKPKHPPGPPMTLGNMRGLGVQNLVASCLNDTCRHQAHPH